jgi:hypothetical protein
MRGQFDLTAGFLPYSVCDEDAEREKERKREVVEEVSDLSHRRVSCSASISAKNSKICSPAYPAPSLG